MRRDARATTARSDQGITMLEVIVAVLILGLIMGPLTLAFMSGLRNTKEAERLLGESRSAQQIASLWTRDVQNVEPGGVNTQEACPPREPADPPVPEEHLVTFAWGSATSAAAPQSATWVVVGSGENATVVRRACTSGQPTEQQTVADSFGLSREDPSVVVRGPLPSDPRQFCPPDSDGVGRSCTIVVDGRYSYHLTVDRRVPDTTEAALPETPPGPPTITLAEPRRQRINVGWTPPTLSPHQPPVIAYRVFLYASPTGDPIDSEELPDTEHVFEGLTNGNSYWVQVQARNAVGWGPVSEMVGPVVPSNSSPEAPTVLSVTPGDQAVEVSWSPNTNDGGETVTQWRIYAETLGGGEAANAVVDATGGSTETGELPGLLNGQTYRISVAGINSLGEGPRSARSDEVVPYGVPGQPSIIGLESLPDGTIVLEWNEPTTLPDGAISPDGGRPITGYRIRAVTGSPNGPWPATGLFPEDRREHIITGLAVGVTYSFVVEAHNPRGFSTSEPSADGVSATPPGQPRDVVATQLGIGTVRLTWNPPASDGGSPVTGYVVRRTAGGTVSLGPGASSYDFTGLASGQTYAFYVRAVNAVGQGPEASQNETALGDPSPVSVAVTRQGSSYPFAVNVTWAPPSNRGGGCITSYRVEYSTNGSSVAATQTLASTPGSAPACAGEPGTSLSWTGLTAGVRTRYFRVVATNTGGRDSTSGWATINLEQLCTVEVTEDAHTSSRYIWLIVDERGNNYGADGELRVERSPDRYTFLKFDPRSTGSTCSQFPGTLPTAGVTLSGAVRVYISETSNFCRDHRIYRATGSWNERNPGGVTWNNQPGHDQAGGQICSNGSTGYRSFSVSVAQIDQQRTGARNGWMIRDVGGNIGSFWADYRSREGNASQAARLDVWFY